MSTEQKRLPRLTEMLTLLQSGKIVTAAALARKFEVSTRTIYRDIKSLEESGVPIITEEGKGYTLMDGYRIPPVMFTESEANALITAELIVNSSKDASLIAEFSSAIQKIKAVLPNRIKLQIEQLEQKVAITKFYTQTGEKSKFLSRLQQALLERIVIKINYANAAGTQSSRAVEPFALFANSNDEWVLVAHCRLRNEFRTFSLSRIAQVSFTDENFAPHPMTFEQYIKKTYNG